MQPAFRVLALAIILATGQPDAFPVGPERNKRAEVAEW